MRYSLSSMRQPLNILFLCYIFDLKKLRHCHTTHHTAHASLDFGNTNAGNKTFVSANIRMGSILLGMFFVCRCLHTIFTGNSHRFSSAVKTACVLWTVMV